MKHIFLLVIAVAMIAIGVTLLRPAPGTTVNRVQVSFGNNREKIAFLCGIVSEREVYVLSSDGNNPIQITNGDLLFSSIVWLESTSRFFGSAAPWTYGSNGESLRLDDIDEEIYEIDFEHGLLNQITSNGFFHGDIVYDISFSNNQIGFIRRGHWFIYTMSLDGSNVDAIPTDFEPRSMKWTSDERIVYWSDYKLYQLLPDEDVQFTDHVASWMFDFSPDGRTIVLISEVENRNSQQYALSLLPATGGNSVVISHETNAFYDTPTWSPDGEWIAFSAVIPRFHDRRQLYKIRPDGTELQPITNVDCNPSNPIWLF
jgi:Tol biopolymer transport system component